MDKPFYEISLKDSQLHIAKGNSKIGKTIYNFSTLPGNKDHLIKSGTSILTNIPGTCSHNCSNCFASCYAVSSARRHHNVVIKAWGENTLLLRYDPDRLFSEIDALITKKNTKYLESNDPKKLRVKIFRINVSGEIESLQELERWNNLADSHREVSFGLYTKNFEILDQFMQEHGDTSPNLCINISQWHHVADEILSKYPGKFNIFEYDDSNIKNNTLSPEDIARLASLTKCPAVDAKGHHTKTASGDPITCDHCLRCYRKTGKTTAVYSH